MSSRDRIRVEAEQLFATRGFAGASLSRIAAASGLGNAGLLHHFPSKAALYRAVLESIAADVDSRSVAAVEVTDDPVAQLGALVDGLLSLHRDRPSALMIIAHEMLDRSGRIEDARVLPPAGVVRVTVGVIEAGQREGSMREGDPVAMTAALHGALLYGVAGRLVYERTGERPDDGSWESEVAMSAIASVMVTGSP